MPQLATNPMTFAPAPGVRFVQDIVPRYTGIEDFDIRSGETTMGELADAIEAILQAANLRVLFSRAGFNKWSAFTRDTKVQIGDGLLITSGVDPHHGFQVQVRLLWRDPAATSIATQSTEIIWSGHMQRSRAEATACQWVLQDRLCW